MRRAAVLAVGFVLSCGGGGGGTGDDGGSDGPPPFDAAITRIVVEVDYADGAEPYTGSIVAFGDTWDLTRTNLDRLFAGKRDLTVPSSLADMQAIGPVADGALTSSEILALAAAHRDMPSAGDTVSYYVVFVDSRFDDGSGPSDSVLGVSIGDTGVIAMFKPVIASSATPLFPNLEKFVEQSVLVHELGHGVGLVNNGVPLTSAHQDSAHGAHCTSDSCVMYWQNEGVSDAAAFARQYVTSGTTILFGAECLADVDALTGGP